MPPPSDQAAVMASKRAMAVSKACRWAGVWPASSTVTKTSTWEAIFASAISAR